MNLTLLSVTVEINSSAIIQKQIYKKVSVLKIKHIHNMYIIVNVFINL